MVIKLLSGIMSFIMMVSFSDYLVDGNIITTSTVSSVSYVSESEAEAIANQCIQNQIGQVGCR